MRTRMFAAALSLLFAVQTSPVQGAEEETVRVSPTSPLEIGSQASLAALRGRDDARDGPLRLAFVPVAPEFAYYAAMGVGVEARAREVGAEIIVAGPPGSGDNDVHIAIIEEIVARPDVHGLIVAVRDAELAAPVMRRAVDAGIVVVVANSDLRSFPTPVHAVVGYSQFDANRKMGDHAGRLTASEPTLAAIIEGAAGYHSTAAVEGFRAGIAGHGHLEVVSSLAGGWSVEGGRAAAAALLRDQPEIGLIWAANDNMILGAREAADEIGRSDLVLLGRDGDPRALRAVAEGRISATIDTDPEAIGNAAAGVVIDALAGHFDGGFVETPTRLVGRSQAASPKPNTD